MSTPGFRHMFFLFCFSLLYTLLLNTCNTEAIRSAKSGPRSLVYNSAVYSIDNYWYVNQVKNLIKYGRFTVDPARDKYEVRRTPVYPLFYGVHYLLFGEEGSYYYIRYTQAFLLALAVVALFVAVARFTGSYRIAWAAALLYGCYPPVAVATGFTMTESLSSELVCFCLFFLSGAVQDKRIRSWFLAGFAFAVAALCRPTVIFLAISVAWLLWYQNKHAIRSLIRNGMAFALGACLLFGPWVIRNYRLTGDIILLEKFYGDPMDYGMPNIHLREWISCWTNPADFTSESVSNAMRYNLMQAHPAVPDSVIQPFIRKMPQHAFYGNPPDSVAGAFLALYRFYEAKNSGEQTRIQASETTATDALVRLKINYVERAPFDYYVVRYLRFLRSIVFQSNAYSLAFLDDYERSLPKIAGKAILYVISILSWASLVLVYFRVARYRLFYWFSVLFIVLSSALPVVLWNYYEARYAFPFFPLLFGLLGIWIVEAFDYFSSQKTGRTGKGV